MKWLAKIYEVQHYWLSLTWSPKQRLMIIASAEERGGLPTSRILFLLGKVNEGKQIVCKLPAFPVRLRQLGVLSEQGKSRELAFICLKEHESESLLRKENIINGILPTHLWRAIGRVDCLSIIPRDLIFTYLVLDLLSYRDTFISSWILTLDYGSPWLRVCSRSHVV